MIFSEYCDNPSQGFDVINGCLVARAGQGYNVYTLEECNELLNKRFKRWKKQSL